MKVGAAAERAQFGLDGGDRFAAIATFVPVDVCAKQVVEQQIAGRRLRPLAAQNEAAPQTKARRGGGRLATVVALWRAGRHQVVAPLSQRVRHQELQLARLVAAGGQPGLIVALDPQFWPTQVARQALQRLDGRWQEGNGHAVGELGVHRHSEVGRRGAPTNCPYCSPFAPAVYLG
jgi:hypothetical protein